MSDDLPDLLTSPFTYLDRVRGRGRLTPVRYRATVTPADPKDASLGLVQWLVQALVLEERLDAPYRLELTLAADDPDLDVDGLVGGRVALEIARDDVRTIHGIVLHAELVGPHAEGALVKLDVGPTLALCGIGMHSRVFQDLTVPQILAKVAGPTLSAYRSALVPRLVAEYAPRDYCVQYRESDLDFFLRLCAEDGIALMFDHEGDAERVVLVDVPQAFPRAGDEPLVPREDADGHPPPLPWIAERAEEAPTESVQIAHRRRRMLPERWMTSRSDWKLRPLELLAAAAPNRLGIAYDTRVSPDEGRPNEGEHSDGPIVNDTVARARLLRERDLTGAVRMQAQTNATVLRAGSTFELMNPFGPTLADEWLVTRIVHRGDVPSSTLHGDLEQTGATYRNDVEAQPLAIHYRPPARERPRIVGVQTARVVNAVDEAIHTDATGRIRVRMPWDEVRHEGDASCWLRVTQPWAGDGFGAVFLPRLGTEVVITFIDGDPDRPLCLGCVYNAEMMPPFSLPEERTRSGIRTRYLDSDRYNEISFEDEPSRAEILLRTHRNLREVVGANHSCSVGGSQTTTVEKNRTTTIAHDDTVTVRGVREEVVEAHQLTDVRGTYTLHVQGSVAAGKKCGAYLFVDHDYVLTADKAITLVCGSSRIEMTPDAITISSPKVVVAASADTENASTCAASVTVDREGVRAQGDRVEAKGKESRATFSDRAELIGLERSAPARLVLGDDATLDATSTVTLRGADCMLAATSSVGVAADDTVGIHARNAVELAGDQSVSINSTGSTTFCALGTATIKGNPINLN